MMGTIHTYKHKTPYKAIAAIAAFVGFLVLFRFILFIFLPMLLHLIYTYDKTYDEDDDDL